MYDVQTILSAYDKQGTLVQWLKNLDEILKSSGLETIEKIEVENGVKLVFKFAGGTTIESPVIENSQKISITSLDIEADSVKIALTDTNGVVVEYYSTLTVNGENVESNIKILFPIKGSESVIVDVDENGTAIEIHLDADILSDINRALKTPLANPSATELVAVDTNGAQTMLEIGQGLKVSAGILEADIISGNYVLELTGESGTLTDEQYQAVVNNFPKVIVKKQVGNEIILLNPYYSESGIFVFTNISYSENAFDSYMCMITPEKTFSVINEIKEIPTSSSGTKINVCCITDNAYSGSTNMKFYVYFYIFGELNVDINNNFTESELLSHLRDFGESGMYPASGYAEEVDDTTKTYPIVGMYYSVSHMNVKLCKADHPQLAISSTFGTPTFKLIKTI